MYTLDQQDNERNDDLGHLANSSPLRGKSLQWNYLSHEYSCAWDVLVVALFLLGDTHCDNVNHILQQNASVRAEKSQSGITEVLQGMPQF
jgi:hypothetical protein